MYPKENTQPFKLAVCGLIIAIILLAPGIIPCAGTVSRTTVGSAAAAEEERPIHPGYPKAFDNLGRVDRIADGEVVISDSLFRLSPDVTYHAPGDSRASRSVFHTGDYVGCLMNTNGEIESIWLIRHRKR